VQAHDTRDTKRLGYGRCLCAYPTHEVYSKVLLLLLQVLLLHALLTSWPAQAAMCNAVLECLSRTFRSVPRPISSSIRATSPLRAALCRSMVCSCPVHCLAVSETLEYFWLAPKAAVMCTLTKVMTIQPA
jgi:hypothetical protein